MSSIFDSFLATPEAQEAFGPPAYVAAMLRFESALADAQAQAGLVPAASAQVIRRCCDPARFDARQIAQDSARAGSVAIPLVLALKEAVRAADPKALAHVHLGATSQDVIDTASALCSRAVLDLLAQDLRRAAAALLALAQQHAQAPMLARTLGQPASVTSFGLKCTQWAGPLVRSLARLGPLRRQALCVQLGGAVGTQSQLEGKGPEVVAHMAQALDLTAPPWPWHTQRDAWLALGCELGLVAGSLGKVARDIALMAQWEVGEVAEPAEPGRGGSSAMSHKRNPVAAMVALAAAQRAPQCVAGLLAAMPQDHERGLGNWQAELAHWPELLQAAQGSAHAMAHALQGLQVEPARMRANLDKLGGELPAQARAEWFAPGLVQHAARMAGEQRAVLQQMLEDSRD